MASLYMWRTAIACVLSLPILVRAACPTGVTNGTVYIDANNKRYKVLCDVDSTIGAYATVNNVASFDACLQQCDAANGAGCNAVTYSGTACYLKKGFVGTNPNVGIISAHLYNPQNYPEPVTGASNASTGCGLALPAGIQAGARLFNFTFTPPDGTTRWNLIHIPSSYNVNKASPLVVSFHGQYGDASANAGESLWHNEVWNPFAITVFVNAVNATQTFESNPQFYNVAAQPRDQDYVNALLTYLEANFCIDKGREFASGQSNGGGLDAVLACNSTLGARFAAFAPHCGAFYTNTVDSGQCNTITDSVLTNNLVQSSCAPGRRVPIIEIHGDADAVIPYTGGPRKGFCLPSVTHWVQDWAARNSLPSANVTTSNYAGSSLVTKFEFGTPGIDLGFVTHIRLSGWGHAFSTVGANGPIDSAAHMMDFFYRMTNSSGSSYDFLSTSVSTSSQSSTSATSAATSRSSCPATAAGTSLGVDTFTTVPYPPTCSDKGISSNIYAVTDLNCTQYLYMCGGGTKGDAPDLATVLPADSFVSCMSFCDGYNNCSGASYNNGDNYGVQNAASAGGCTLKSTSGTPTWQSTMPATAATNQLKTTRVAMYKRQSIAPTTVTTTTTMMTSSSSASLTTTTSSSSSSLAATTSFSSSIASTSASPSTSGSSSTSSTSSTSSSTASTSAAVSLSTSTNPACPATAAGTTVGVDGFTTVPFPPSCTDKAISNDTYAVTDPNCVQFLFICGGGSKGDPPDIATVTAGSWMSCLNLCDGYPSCVGGSYNNGGDYGVQNGLGSGACTLKSTSGQPTWQSTLPATNAVSQLKTTRVAFYNRQAIAPTTASTTPLTTLSSSSVTTSSSATLSTSTSGSTSNPTSSSSSTTLASSSTITWSSASSTSSSNILSFTTVSSGSASSSLSSTSSSITSGVSSSISSTVTSASSTASSGTSLPSTNTASTASSSLAASSSIATTSTSVGSSSTPISSSRSTVTTSSAVDATASSYPSFSCPADNNKTIVDNAGISYQLMCSSDTHGGAYAQSQATLSSFNDCFANCSALNTCTGVTYGGTANGAGNGFCYYKEADPNYFVPSDIVHVGMVKIRNYNAALNVSPSSTRSSSSFSAVVTTSISSSMPSTSSSLITSSMTSLPGTYLQSSQPATSSSTTSTRSAASTTTTSPSSSSSSLLSTSVLSGSGSPAQSTSSLTTASTSASITAYPQSTSPLSASTTVASSTSRSSNGISTTSSYLPSSSTCSNYTTVIDGGGVPWCIYCDSDSTRGNFDVRNYGTGTYYQCFYACEDTSQCTNFVWAPGVDGGGACYLKDDPSTPVIGASNAGKIAGFRGACVSGTASTSITATSLRSPTASASRYSTTAAIPGSVTSSGSTSTRDSRMTTTSSPASATSTPLIPTYSQVMGLSTDLLSSLLSTSSQGPVSSPSRYTTPSQSSGGSSSTLSVSSSPASSTSTLVRSPPVYVSTASMAGSTSSASSLSTTSTMSTCTANPQWTDARGVVYAIYCDADTSGDGAFDVENFASGDYTQCGPGCDSRPSCGAWVWAPGDPGMGGTCYYKHLPQQPKYGSPGFVAGVGSGGSSASSTAASTARTLTSNIVTASSGSVSTSTSTVAPSVYSTLIQSSASVASLTGTIGASSTTGSSSSSIVGSSNSGRTVAPLSASDITEQSSLRTALPYTGSQSLPMSPATSLTYQTGQPSMITSESMFPASLESATTSEESAMLSVSTQGEYTTSTSSVLVKSNSTMESSILETQTSEMASLPVYSSAELTFSESASSTSELPSCQVSAVSSAGPSGSGCQDPYGNEYTVTYSNKKLVGTVAKRQATRDLDQCLVLCDTTPGCEGVNYQANGQCEVLTNVVGTTTVQGSTSVAAATRPPDATTTYTVPPSTTITPTSSISRTGTTSNLAPASSAIPSATPTYQSSTNNALSASTRSSRSSVPEYSSPSSGSSASGSASLSGHFTTLGKSSALLSSPLGSHIISSILRSSSTTSPMTYVSGSPAPACAGGSPDISACGASDGTTCNDPNGKAFYLECDSAPSGGTVIADTLKRDRIPRSTQPSFGACLGTCGLNPACIAVTYQNATQTCTMYSSLSGGIGASPGTQFGRREPSADAKPAGGAAAITASYNSPASSSNAASSARTIIVYSTQVVTMTSCSPGISSCPASTYLTSIAVSTVVDSKTATASPTSESLTRSSAVVTVYVYPSKCPRGTTTIFTTRSISSCPAKSSCMAQSI